MVVSVYLRSPVAVVWTLLGGVVVGALAAGGWAVAATLRAAAAANPLFLGGLVELLYLLALLLVGLVLAVAWLPFGAGVAYAVGRRARGRPAGFRTSVTAVLDAVEEGARWLKTRAAVPGVAERLLTEDDVAPAEVVTGCRAFVVPALVLDAPDALERAVDRANRVPPRSGRERLWAGCLGVSLLAAGGGYLGGTVGIAPGVDASVAGGLLVAGLVLTAALDAAWRAETYATEDVTEGFRT